MRNNIYPLMALGNEEPIHNGLGQVPVGTIALANEARLVGATYSEPLTQFTVGYRDPENLIAAADYIAPPVPVGRRFEFKKADDSKFFLSETDDERAIGGAFKKVEYSGSTQLGRTTNRGLTYTLDIDEDGGATTEESIVAMLLQRIARNKYRRAMTALLALNAGSASVWNDTANADELMREAMAAAQLDSGVYPNRGLVGLQAWNLRSKGLAAQNNAGAYAALARTASQVASELMLDDLRVDKALFQNTVSAKVRIVGSQFIAFTARDGLSKDDPSNLKQFYTPVGGGRYRVHRKVTGPADKFVEITVEHYEGIVGTSTLGVTRLNVAAS